MKSKHSPGLSGFDWKDPFLLEAQITPEERMARDTAAEFARSTLVPGVLDDFNNEVTNPDIFRRMERRDFLERPFRKIAAVQMPAMSLTVLSPESWKG